jgi:catechol 2,3-dioxygenase
MSLPSPPAVAPFSITRVSHVVLNVCDLAASREFYERLLGLVTSAEDGDRVYLRGVEEAAHHSLVLQKADGVPSAERVGFRVASDADLDAAQRFFQERGLPNAWVDVPYQGRTLHVSDVAGVPLELCASMAVERRLVLDEALHQGAAAARIDHLQVHVRDVAAWVDFYVGLGFRISEYATPTGGPDAPLLGAFLSRKGDLLDLVGVTGPGPRLHHFSFVVHNAPITLTRVCDLASAMGRRDVVEYGPGRHGLAPQHFLYLRDPDGHRAELVSHGYQLLDPEVEPVGWSIDDPRAVTTWGAMPPQAWMHEASAFSGITPSDLSVGESGALSLAAGRPS